MERNDEKATHSTNLAESSQDGIDEGSNIPSSSSTSPVSPPSPPQAVEHPASSPPPQKRSPTRTLGKKSNEDRDRIRLALHRSPYFTCLDEEQVERFIELARLEEYGPEQAVILEGCRDEREEEDHGSGILQRANVQIPRRLSTDGYADSDEFILLDDEGDEIFEIELESAAESLSKEPALIEESSTQPQSPDAMLLQDQDTSPSNEAKSGPSSASLVVPPAPTSGKKSSVYIVKRGTADVFYNTMTPASLGPGTMFGEGGFLFGLPHSASIVARSPVECWVIDYDTFCKEILPSDNMKNLFKKYAAHHDGGDSENVAGSDSDSDGEGDQYMTMDDFIESCLETSAKVGDGKPSDDSGIVNAHASSIESTFQNFRDLSKEQVPLFSDSWKPSKNTNRVHFTEFCLFHMLMARPDPEVDIAFLLMDRQRTGRITFDDFAAYIENGPFPHFDLKSEFVKRHFGPSGRRTIRNFQFSQFLLDLQREMGRQAFLYAARQHTAQSISDTSFLSTNRRQDDDGFLPPKEFISVLTSACGWRLPEGVVDRLECLYVKGTAPSVGSNHVDASDAKTTLDDSANHDKDQSMRSMFNYGDFLAFQDCLERLPGIVNVIDHACGITNGRISQDDFKVANRVIGLGGRLSRRQVDFIFQLFDKDKDGFISVDDAVSVIGSEFVYRLEPTTGRQGKVTLAPPPDHRAIQGASSSSTDFSSSELNPLHDPDDDMLTHVFKMTTQFLLASISGGIGILAVYPLDLVKTRMMNQRTGPNGEGRMYLQSFHCLAKTVKHEGFLGLYRGLLPPLLAVGPEKTIKFAVNDLLRGLSAKQDHSYLWWMEILSGGCAGACQLLVTNPFEITKIRLQLQGETSRILNSNGLPIPKPMSFSRVAADLGGSGLYRGAAACLLRDVPFGAIYFPAYAACKNYLVLRENSGATSTSTLLLAGTVAAIPAALFTTPADLIKTRLQVIPRAGEMTYSGIGDCIRKVYELEGPTAFFKGSAFRVARIAPQFGISLLCYEKLCQLVGFKVAVPPTNAPVDPRDYRAAFPTRAVEAKTEDIDDLVRNMGFQPKAQPRPPVPPKGP